MSKTFFILFLAFFAVTAPSPLASAQNIVKNSGFEDYVNGMMLDWKVDDSAGANYQVARKGHSGERSIQIVSHPEKFRIFQYLHLESELKYKLSVYMKSMGASRTRRGFVAVIDSKWKWSSDRLYPDSPNSDWKQYSVEFYPNKSAHRLIVYKYDNFSGSTFFDDITVEKVYTSAGITLSLDDYSLKGKGTFSGILNNFHDETATFNINMKITDDSGAEIQKATRSISIIPSETSKPFSFNYLVPNSGYYDIRFEVFKDGKIVDIVSKNIEFKDIITLQPINPHSRKLLKFENTREIKTRVLFNKELEHECDLTLSITKRDAAAVLASETQKLPRGQDTTFVLPVSNLAFGKYLIRAKLTQPNTISGHLIDEVAYPLDILDPRQSVGFDKQNNLLVNGEKFFPMGFTGNMVYHRELATLKSNGFNTLLFYAPYGISDGKGGNPIKLYLDQLKANGLKGIPYVARYRKSQSSLRSLAHDIKKHPALLAYDIADEPNSGQPYSDFSNAYGWLSDDDPAHPVALVIATPSMSVVYKNVLDVVMVDPYPNKIPKEPQRIVYDDVMTAHELIGGKAVWDILPTFGREFISNWPNANFTYPTPREMRNDYYLAIVAGSKGLIGYAYNSYRSYEKYKKYKIPGDYITYWKDPNRIFLPEENPAIWDVCKTVASEVKILKPFIFAPESKALATLTPASENIHYLYKKWGNTHGILMVNSSKQPHSLTVTIPEKYTGHLSKPIAGGSLTCDNGVFHATLGPYQDLYLEFEQPNLVANSGFENNFTNYAVESDVEKYFELTSDTVHEGVNALRITGKHAGESVLKQEIHNLEAGQKYQLSVLMKAENITTIPSGFVAMTHHDGSWESDHLVPSQANTDWQEYRVEFTAQEAGDHQIVIQKREGFSGNLYIDEIRLTPLALP